MAANKVELIYEFNKNSPLFSRVAASKLSERNFEEAAEILREGLKLYPNYPTPYIIYGLSLAYAGEIEEAKNNIKKASKMIGSKDTLIFYMRHIEKIAEKNINFSRSQRATFLPSEDITAGENDPGDPADISINRENISLKMNTDMGDLSNEISRVKNSIFKSSLGDTNEEKEQGSFSIQTELASETLASILLKQKKYKEAASVYETLISKYPENAEDFKNKVREIKKKIADS